MSVRVGSLTAPTTGGTPQDQSVSGLGFEPKALIFWCSQQTAPGLAASYRTSIGFATGPSDQRSLALASDDNVGTTNNARNVSQKALTILSAANGSSADVDGEFDLKSLDPGGFTITWTDVPATAVQVHYMAIGGPDVTNAKAGHVALSTSAGVQSYTGVGFQPDVALFLYSESRTAFGSAAHAVGTIGAAKSSTERWSVSLWSRDGQTCASAARAQRAQTVSLCVSGTDEGGSRDTELDFSAFSADGFQLNQTNPPTAADILVYLCLKGGSYSVGNFAKATATGDQDVTVSPAFQPEGHLLCAANTTNNANTVQNNVDVSLGAADDAGSDAATWFGQANNTLNTQVDRASLTSRVYESVVIVASPSATEVEGDHVQMNADGFRINWNPNNTAAEVIMYFAARGGQAGAGGPSAGLRTLALTGVGT